MKLTRTKNMILLNQMAGPLFRQLAEDLSHKASSVILYTGHLDTINYAVGQSSKDKLILIPATTYNRTSYFNRILSWIQYFLGSFIIVGIRTPKNPLLIVSNPPFMGLIGLFYKKIRNQQYFVVIYDIYPDILINLGRLKEGLFSRVWDKLNSVVYANATAVFCIGNYMTKKLKRKYCQSEKMNNKFQWAPGWVDIEIIKPLEKDSNWFARKYNLTKKTTVIYSGNMGNSHNIETIILVALLLRWETDIHFLFIGEGEKVFMVREAIRRYHLNNITLLPLQPENVLPYSLTAGDIGVVSYQSGTEECMVPSKAYYYLAAGLFTLVVSDMKNDISEIVIKNNCGIMCKSSESNEIAKRIKNLHKFPEKLKRYKRNARRVAENYFTRQNSNLIVHKIASLTDN